MPDRLSDDHITQIRERLQKQAESYNKEARALDNEYPEPDAFCSAWGGDGARSTAALMREVLALVDQLRQERDEVCRALMDSPNVQHAGFVALAKAAQADSELLNRVQDDDLTVREALQEREQLKDACARLRTALEEARVFLLAVGWHAGVERIDAALALPDASGAGRREEQEK